MLQPAQVISFVESLIRDWGIIIVPIGAFLENSVILGFIFPGVTIIFLAGYVARVTGESIWLIVILATIGSFVGDNFDYFLGKNAGKLLKAKPLFAKPVEAVEPFLARHGAWAVFAGRFSGWSRAWVALACGVVGYKYVKFAPISFISASIWTSAWIVGGYLVGGNRELITNWFQRGSLLVWVGFLALAIYYFRTRIKLVYDLILVFFVRSKTRIRNGFFNNQH